ncbi:hypothetical protein AZH51_06530 [Branchiibius sp. NY16-3462-2]|nr:hypothetical protein AZH51_06530 [Branchiibius sp. NY16-3462-2]
MTGYPAGPDELADKPTLAPVAAHELLNPDTDTDGVVTAGGGVEVKYPCTSTYKSGDPPEDHTEKVPSEPSFAGSVGFFV